MGNIKIDGLPVATNLNDTDQIVVSQGTGAGDVKSSTLALLKTYIADESSVTVDNGLTNTNGNIGLGGSLSAPTNIGLAGNNLVFSDTYSQLVIGGNVLYASVADSNYHGSIVSLNPGELYFNYNNGAGLQSISFDGSRILIADGSANIGFVYSGDYSAAGSHNSLWIPNWGFIQSQITSAISLIPSNTFDNGLTDNNGIVGLGGSITESTAINISNNLAFYDTTNNSVQFNLNPDPANGLISMGSGGSGSFAASLQLNGGDIYLQTNATVGGNVSGINLNPSYFEIIDSINNIGIIYAADYSVAGSQNPLWIPNWGFIQSQITSSINSYVPYTGATANLDLGNFQLNAGLLSASTVQGTDSTLGVNLNIGTNGVISALGQNILGAYGSAGQIFFGNIDGGSLSALNFRYGFGLNAMAIDFTTGQVSVNNAPINPADIVRLEDLQTAIAVNATQTSVTGSTSGGAKFSQPFQGSTYKKVIIYCSALSGTASYTFPTAFINTPAIVTTNGPAASVVTSLSSTGITITGAPTTGYIELTGY